MVWEHMWQCLTAAHVHIVDLRPDHARVRAAEVIADVERPQQYRWRLLRALYAVFRRRHGSSSRLTSRVATARGRLDLLQSRPLQPTGEAFGGASLDISQ